MEPIANLFVLLLFTSGLCMVLGLLAWALEAGHALLDGRRRRARQRVGQSPPLRRDRPRRRAGRRLLPADAARKRVEPHNRCFCPPSYLHGTVSK